MEILLIVVSCFTEDETWTALVEDLTKSVKQIVSKIKYCFENKWSLNRRMLLILHGINIKIGGGRQFSRLLNYFKMFKFNIIVLAWSESEKDSLFLRV